MLGRGTSQSCHRRGTWWLVWDSSIIPQDELDAPASQILVVEYDQWRLILQRVQSMPRVWRI
jgi:hypothetical protein